MDPSLEPPPNWALGYQQFIPKTWCLTSQLLKKWFVFLAMSNLSGTKNSLHLCPSPSPRNQAWPHTIQTNTYTRTAERSQSQVLDKESLTITSLLFWNAALERVGQLNEMLTIKMASEAQRKTLWRPQLPTVVFYEHHNALLIADTHPIPEDEPALVLYTKHTLIAARAWRGPADQLCIIIPSQYFLPSLTPSSDTSSSWDQPSGSHPCTPPWHMHICNNWWVYLRCYCY